MDRKTAILRSANEHFASYGFRGASLRDIARDAQVSLTLLNHHFGSKLDLLRAVIHAHRRVLDEPVSRIRALLAPGMPTPRMESVLGVWLDVVQDTATERDGRYFLRLLARMSDDPQAEAASLVRDSIEASAQALMDAVCAVYPGATRRQAALAYLCISTSMLKCATAAERLGQLEGLGQPASGPAVAAPAPRPEFAMETVGEGAEAEPPAAAPSPADAARDSGSTARPPERELLMRFLLGGVEALVRAG